MPEAIEKREIVKQSRAHRKIMRFRNKKIYRLKKKFNKNVESINHRLKNIGVQKDGDEKKRLKEYQSELYYEALKEYRLEDAVIPNVGDGMKKRLYARKIYSLYDISKERVEKIRGFGVQKVNAVMQWAEQAKQEIVARLPNTLPQTEYEEIDIRYKQRISQLREKIEDYEENLENDLTDLHRDALYKLTSNDLEESRELIDEGLRDFHDISFGKFLKQSYYENFPLNIGKIFIPISFGVIAISFMCLTPMLCSKTSSDIAPTSTPTATATATATATNTPTNTATPTATYTPTITLTPTITNTPTITPTPTNTSTPTITPVPSPTSTEEPWRCDTDYYDCSSSFYNQELGQACYDYCESEGKGDIHNLDSDNDGIACESNDYPVIVPTSSSSGSSDSEVCICSKDTYNCSDGSFSSQRQAQSCFDYCKSEGKGDIHELDGDNDGRVCEGLP